ncbi:AcrB/AcrD/AcrF family protein [Desulfonema ishimotonii]|uniref:AcrB/AcrD/AcrF family protein n=1 Tax=Desulfonema ishimotonii TaxID=45657 RepID=A0A401G3B3_9BACT|nr:efflux RND transporter permease subunit [Desulfonema ishimotonii]GBC63683.1 AcrB/AcrD/AcrF family protein [Desulfonema ishimotonii]
MIRFFAKHPTAANLLMLMFVVLGLVSISSLRRETFPDFSEDKVEISVIYPGATAEDVEEAICKRIEDAVDRVNYVEEITSEARENMGSVTVEMEEGGNIRTFLNDIKTEVDAIDDFPEQAEDPIVKELNRTDQVISVAVSGPMSVTDLKAWCEDLKDRLKLDAGVSLVDVSGFSDRQIRIRIPASLLIQYGISMDDVAGIISRQSVDMPAGTLETREQDILIRFTDERKTPLEFDDLVVVASSSGAEIRLGDIAQIRDVFEKDEDKFIFNGQRAGLLEITKTKSEDTLNVYEAVRDFIEKENQAAPPGVRLTLTRDVASVVQDRLSLLSENGLQGLILVFLTMWLFFNIRLSFWVVMGLPVSFLGAFFFMPQINYSLNLLTMVGLLIGLGLLMDDAIVIAENVATHLSRGKTAINAVVDGVTEVKNGVIASFTTTVCVFGPISFLEGNMGKVLKVMPVVLILVLAVSLVEAFLILPRHLAHSLHDYDPKQTNRFRKRFNASVDRFRENILGRIVDLAIRWRYLFTGLTLAAFIVSVGMMASGALKFRPFPDIDGDTVQARILLPQGTPLEQTEALVTRLTDAIDEVDREFTPGQPGGQHLIQNISVQFNVNSDAYESGAHVATVSADLLKAEVRNAQVDDVLNRWREIVGQVPDVISLKFTEPSIGPAGRAIDIRLRGHDLDQMKSASLEMQAWLKQFKGVFDISDDLRPGKPEVRVRIREGAKALGLDARTIASQLRSAYYGKTASEIQVGRESYEIDVRLADEDKNSLADLSYFHVTLPDGKQAPLGSVAKLTRDRGYARIASVDGLRTVTIQGDVDARMANSGEIMTKLKREFMPTFRQNYPGIRTSLEGEAKESAKTGGSLRRGFMVGLVGIFILLSFQFRSYIEPAVVMIAIPFAFIGVIWGHILMGLELCMPSMMGAVSLAGIVVNDSILLVEFIKIRRRQGQAIPDAARHASRERFRAVLLTSMTTIAGLLPLLSEKSLQAQILIPLATSIVFGLMASTVLVLIVVPSLYTILGDFGLVTKEETEEQNRITEAAV